MAPTKAIEEAKERDRAEAAAKKAAEQKAEQIAELKAEVAQMRRRAESAVRHGFNERGGRYSREADSLQQKLDKLDPPPSNRRAPTQNESAARRATERLGGPEPQALTKPSAPVNPNGGLASQVIAAAESALGVMYKWGGNSLASGVDCSGLVQQAFRAIGIVLPRVSADQARVGQKVASLGDAQPGDLISFDNSTRNKGADHIAIYIGNGKMIEAAKRGTPVRVRDVPGGATINRVIGHVPQKQGIAPPQLGPNRDRQYSSNVQSGTVLPPPPQATGGIVGEVDGGLGDDLPEDATPEQIEAYIFRYYPTVAGFLANPELKKILFDAAEQGLTPDEVKAKIRGTRYWAEQGEAGSQFDLLIAEDPRSAGLLVDKVKNLVSDSFNRNGVSLDDETAGVVAKNAIRFGWVDLNGSIVDEAAMNDFMAFTVRTKETPLGGELAVSADGLKRLARQYFVPLTDTDLREWTLKILEGSESEDSFTQYVADQSRGRFINDQNVLAALDRGLTPDTYFRPLRNTVAEILELNAEDVDLFGNSKYAGLTQFYDANNKVTRSRTLGEAAQWARDQSEFKDTRSYKQQDASFATNIASLFGKAAF